MSHIYNVIFLCSNNKGVVKDHANLFGRNIK